MISNAINKIIYEFTCSTEQEAKTISNELVHYRSPQFQAILEDVFSSHIETYELLNIDKMEIDLGEISAEDMMTDLLTQRFRYMLEASIKKEINKKRFENKNEVISLISGKSYFLQLRYFLLYGDMPWWVDKNKPESINNLFKKALSEDREIVREFLTEQVHNLTLISRIRMNASISVLQQIQDLMHPMNLLSPADAATAIRALKWFAKNGQSIGSLLSVSGTLSLNFIKHFLVSQMFSGNRTVLLQAIRELIDLTDAEERTIEIFEKGQNRSEELQEKVQSILLKCTIHQLELIRQIVNVNSKEVTKYGAQKIKDPSHVYDMKISDLLEIISKKQLPGHYHSIMNLPAGDFNKIYTSMFRLNNEKTARGMLVQLLLNHPQFLLFRIPLLFSIPGVQKIISHEQDDITSTSGSLFTTQYLKAAKAISTSLGKLSNKKKDLITNTFALGKYPVPGAVKIMSQWLGSLPGNALMMIASILTLNEESLRQIAGREFDPGTEEPMPMRYVIENAGLCLLAPFLPAFFRQLGYLEDKDFISAAHAYKAVYVLQYLVYGNIRKQEYALQLNKLLCGLKIDAPLYNKVSIPPKARKEADDLIASAIEHWKVLKSTTIEGFRRSFLQRKGILTANENNWILQVEKSAYDLLLDSLPWSFSMIKLTWMDKLIEVEW